jgi:hypothetical protein
MSVSIGVRWRPGGAGEQVVRASSVSIEVDPLHVERVCERLAIALAHALRRVVVLEIVLNRRTGLDGGSSADARQRRYAGSEDGMRKNAAVWRSLRRDFKRTRSGLALVGLLIGGACAKRPDPGALAERQRITRRLAEMAIEDQRARQGTEPFGGLDRQHADELMGYLERYGWIRISEFGKEADRDAWLIVQHATHDLAFQERVLATLETLVKGGETSKSNYAYLYDRVAMNTNRPQRYGTQGSCEGTVWEPIELESRVNLDQLRREIGLGPFEEYRRQMNAFCRR